MNQNLILEAVETFGEDVVAEVQNVVSISDPDGAWAMFSDMMMDDHVECVEMLYFEN